ncbi:hypothetical protein Acr_26g0006510 [Actinidia rufa]|uniref:Uncharacterized protein n=1 Tax=Actinidia rufa TaxID=165716 RepID=A0A7J0H302_9ERIC|nr:hypothetical protein Acr_26g0006510 [Actinidia rufa]
MVEEETTKYLETVVVLWSLVEEARERSTSWSRCRRQRRADATGGDEEDAGSGDVAGGGRLDEGDTVVLVARSWWW